ncbi:hypothetical protein [Actinoplanes sp. NPDC049118]|uniref:hypothetical protein n=1 Tax=Actinoplanes sp. NPDC049118 TaxID=3155769 RepID=UPI0033E4AD49
MTIQRMDNVLIVVEDLDTVVSFFVELGMELEGRGPVEGRWVERVIGIDDVRQDVAMLRTRTATGSATSVAPRASSSAWPNSSAELGRLLPV